MRMNVPKIHPNKTQSRKMGQQRPEPATSPKRNDFQSPRQRANRLPGINHGDSPGDLEATQDIFWDCTSPTQPALRRKNCKAVKISDIVDRIAPKSIKSKEKECSLLQWIGDSAIPCTPEISKPRVRKRSTRPSSVNDLMKLARQFDENMLQDEQSSGQLNAVSNRLNEHVNTSQTKPVSGHVKDLSSSGRVEAEFHALFDCSTQRVSGYLSDCSACSQEMKEQPVTSAVAQRQQSELESADKPDSAAHPAGQRAARMHNVNSCDDFDDDWENDDLLNDSFVLAMTQNPDEQPGAKPTFQPDNKTNAAPFASVCEPATHPGSSLCKMSSSTLQELCPKVKTTNRRTFRLDPNPYFQTQNPKVVSKFNSTVNQPKSNGTHQKTTQRTPKADKINDGHSRFVKKPCAKETLDSVWDDWDDDALLYQLCDSVEKSSNNQPQPVNPSKRQHIAVDGLKQTTEPQKIDTAQFNQISSNRQSSHSFTRSNSLPGASCKVVNYQGWNIPMKSGNKNSGMSQSFPGSHIGLSGTILPEDTEAKQPHTRAPQNPSHQTTFKRNVSESANINSKVFVTSQGAGKCTAAEIERKKQEALARRRQRSQNISK